MHSWSSNETFLVEVSCGDDNAHAVYKPEAGEKPLLDFEPGLYRRERAAYLLSEYLAWGLVPLTVIRDEAPLGSARCSGSSSATSASTTSPCRRRPETHRHLARIALFDYIANNTDRKSGHACGDDGHVWGIDHSCASPLRSSCAP